MSRVTIYDIAEDVGVSTSTVSRALNGSALIGEGKAREILEAARRLGYRKRTIRRQKGRAILNIRMVLPRRAERVQQLFYDYSDLLAGIKRGLKDNRANLVTDVEGERLNLFESKKGGDVDGVIFTFTRASEAAYRQLAGREIPCLTLHRVVEDRDYITCDNAAGMKRLATELARRIDRPAPCYLRLNAAGEIADERQRGVKEGCEAAGVAFDEATDVVAVDAIDEITAALAGRIASAGYNAVLCFNDVVAAAFEQAARAAAVAIPGRMEITGFDNSPLRDLMRPRPDTISLPVAALGEAAGEWIAERIVNRSDEPFQMRIPGDYMTGDHQ